MNELKAVRESLCLMNAMINCGESHSDMSRELFEKALEQIKPYTSNEDVSLTQVFKDFLSDIGVHDTIEIIAKIIEEDGWLITLSTNKGLVYPPPKPELLSNLKDEI